MPRREDDTNRIVLGWKPIGKRPRGDPGKNEWIPWKNTVTK